MLGKLSCVFATLQAIPAPFVTSRRARLERGMLQEMLPGTLRQLYVGDEVWPPFKMLLSREGDRPMSTVVYIHSAKRETFRFF